MQNFDHSGTLKSGTYIEEMENFSIFLARYRNTSGSSQEQEIGTQAVVKVFPQFVQVLPNFH